MIIRRPLLDADPRPRFSFDHKAMLPSPTPSNSGITLVLFPGNILLLSLAVQVQLHGYEEVVTGRSMALSWARYNH